jgi:hypothetical protein
LGLRIGKVRLHESDIKNRVLAREKEYKKNMVPIIWIVFGSDSFIFSLIHFYDNYQFTIFAFQITRIDNFLIIPIQTCLYRDGIREHQF